MGNATIFLGIEDDRVPEAVELVRRNCQSRVEVKLDTSSPEYMEWFPAGIHEVTVGGGVVFVVPVDRMVRITSDGINAL